MEYVKDDGGNLPIHTTSNGMHENVWTDQSTLITLDEVNKEALEVYQSAVQDLLAGKRTAMTFDGMCRADGCETDGILTASFLPPRLRFLPDDNHGVSAGT